MKPKAYKYKGESKTLGEWAKQLGIPYNNLFMRLKQGWDFARAVEEPIRPQDALDADRPRGGAGGYSLILVHGTRRHAVAEN